MKRNIKLTIIIIAVVGALFSAGLGIEYNKSIFDTKTTPIYDAGSLDGIISASERDFDATKSEYDSRKIVVAGSVADLSENAKSFVLKSDAGKEMTVEISKAAAVQNGDPVRVFGNIKEKKGLSFSKKNKELLIKADAVEKNSAKLDGDYYVYHKEGSSVLYGADFVSRSLAGGKIKYNIPKYWESVEATAEDQKGLFNNIEPEYRSAYFLNALKGKETAELFFVFYFDDKQHKAYDEDWLNLASVEKAIVKNICPQASKVDHQNVKTPYGMEYEMYVSEFETHRVEFVFTPVEGGTCVMMYVYNADDSSADDIRYILRTLEVKKE